MAYAVWRMAFADTGSVLVSQDNQDMSMAVGIAGFRPDAVFRVLLMAAYIPLKPEGVRINWYAVTPDGGNLFAWIVIRMALPAGQTRPEQVGAGPSIWLQPLRRRKLRMETAIS